MGSNLKRKRKEEATEPYSSDVRIRVLKNGLAFNKDNYTYDDSYKPAEELSANSVHSTMELMGLLEKDKKIEIEARVMAFNFNEGERGIRKITNRDSFIQLFKESGKRWTSRRMREDLWAMDQTSGQIVNDHDFVPLLGGPFYKQLYMYDYLRMHNACFYAWHHDPVAKATVEMITDFVLGRGFKIQSEDDASQIIWDAFHEVNDMDAKAKMIMRELLVYGENMIWKLPNNSTKITWQLAPNQTIPKGIIPRIRLIDPSVIWEIITFPEDIERVIAYQWVAPTQYQIYTAPSVPTTKFIFTQIPADQVIHTKINAASNEKRGRSELFASLGYMKRLRDAVDYSIVSDMKRAAWSIDTEVRGSQADVDAYFSSQQALGTIPSAGSEFIHTEAVKRTYLSNPGSASNASTSFEWALSMCAIGNRIPTSYYGTHMSGGQTRASALVSTEPVAKMFESKQQMIQSIFMKLHRWVTGKDCEVIFPEIIAQDSATKIRNIVVADANQYFAKDRAATMVAKELNVTDFDYDKEKAKIEQDIKDGLDMTGPLTSPGALGSNPPKSGKADSTSTTVTPGTGPVGGAAAIPAAKGSTGGSGWAGEDKAQVRNTGGF